jgi:anti-sigma factor RsiW
MNAHPAPSHPAAEQWADYLYGELTPELRRELEAHARECPACQSQLAQWRETMSALDACQVRPRARAITGLADAVRWAVAAGLVLGLGWLGGRFASPAPVGPDLQQIRAELQPAVERALREEFEHRLQSELAAAQQQNEERLVALAQTWAATRAEDQEGVFALYQRAEQKRRTEHAALRRDLETVAVVAQDAIGSTQQQLTQLAVNTQGRLPQ